MSVLKRLRSLTLKSKVNSNWKFSELWLLLVLFCAMLREFIMHTWVSEVTSIVSVVSFHLVTAVLSPSRGCDFPPPLDFWRCRETTGLHGNKIITSLLSSCCRQAGVWPSSAAAWKWLHTHTQGCTFQTLCSLPAHLSHMSQRILLGGCYSPFRISLKKKC